MKSFNRLLLVRYAVAVLILAIAIAIFVVVSPAAMPEWVVVAVSMVLVLAVIYAINIWTQKRLAADLHEIGSALEKIVVENDLDRMPQPRLSELSPLAHDLDTVASRVRANYEIIANEKEKLEAIVDNSNAGIIVLVEGGRIDTINPAAERILGVSREYALERSFSEIHNSPAIDKVIDRAKRGQDVTQEVNILMPRRRTLRVLASPIRGGVDERVVCILEDVTTRRRLERTRRDFVANVSHELRTPVANVRAVLDALASGALEDPDMSRRFIEDLDRESTRLAEIIEDLLVLSRLESDELSLAEERCEVDTLLSGVMEEKRALAERSGVKLRADGRTGLAVLGDPKLIRTALANLMDNAIKYNRPGGSVNVEVREIGGDVAIDFSDTGIGIPESEQARIFERFYRVDKARSRETGGTGLGLSIVKHAAELHGGSVSIRSAEGHGSTFTLVLPASSTLF